RDGVGVGDTLRDGFRPVEPTGGGHAHAALRRLQLHPAVDHAPLAGILAEAGLEDRLHAADVAVALRRPGIQPAQLGARPEALLEALRLALGAVQDLFLADRK